MVATCLSFRMKIFYPIQTSIHVGMSTLKKTTKMGQWYIFAAIQQQKQTNICWDKTCVWVMEFKITTLPLLNWHHWTDRKTDKKLFPSFRAHSMHACTQSNCISVAGWAILMLERTYKPSYHYQNFSPLANGTDLNREKYAILQTYWH